MFFDKRKVLFDIKVKFSYIFSYYFIANFSLSIISPSIIFFSFINFYLLIVIFKIILVIGTNNKKTIKSVKKPGIINIREPKAIEAPDTPQSRIYFDTG